jgi:hypothetical protein
MEPRPLSTELGEKQAFFAEGISAPMSYFVCKSCKNKFLDSNLYFYDIKSVTCLWCTKFPRRK